MEFLSFRAYGDLSSYQKLKLGPISSQSFQFLQQKSISSTFMKAAHCTSLKPLNNILPYAVAIFVPLSGTKHFESREYL